MKLKFCDTTTKFHVSFEYADCTAVAQYVARSPDAMLLPLIGEISVYVLGGACCITWCCCQCIAIAINKMKPWPTFQGNVVSISSMSEWSALLEDAGVHGRLLIVDCFAYWCPPCKAAALTYAQMSLEYEEAVFAKVDVDAASDVARLLEVSAMPTFFLFEVHSPDYTCVDKCVGWSESGVRRMLESRGVQRVPSEASKHKGGHGEEKRSLMSSQV